MSTYTKQIGGGLTITASFNAQTGSVQGLSPAWKRTEVTSADPRYKADRLSLVITASGSSDVYILFGTGSASVSNKSDYLTPSTGQTTLATDFYKGPIQIAFSGTSGGITITEILETV